MNEQGPCPFCGLLGGFHETKDGVPICGHLDVSRTGWEYAGTKTPPHDEYAHHWYVETTDERAGICHVIRQKPLPAPSTPARPVSSADGDPGRHNEGQQR